MIFSAQFNDVKIDNFFLSQIKNSFGLTLPQWAPKAIYMGIGILLAGLVVYTILKRITRVKHIDEIVQNSRNKVNYSVGSDKELLDFLRRNSVVLDMVVGDIKWYSIAVRAIIVSLKRKTVQCEIIEDFAKDILDPGTPVTCTFRPVTIRGKKISNFRTEFSRFEITTNKYTRFELKRPETFGLAKRRRHPRKKVLDQQFIRTKLWFEQKNQPIDYLEATPNVAVNSYDGRAMEDNDNSVINISRGGIGLSVDSAQLNDYDHTPGTNVVMNIFLYSHKEKEFKAYWYSGVIRGSEETKPGTMRLGIQFRKVAFVDEGNQFHWETL